MINSNSRYANATIDLVTDHRGTHQSIGPLIPQAYVFDFTFYQTEYGDTVEWLAYLIFGDGRLWWLIANANPEILDWSDIPTGTILRIPNVS